VTKNSKLDQAFHGTGGRTDPKMASHYLYQNAFILQEKKKKSLESKLKE
jgi:hypothetical protein